MVSLTATLGTNTLSATTAALALTNELTHTMYIVAKSGAHKNHIISFQFSPDGGTTWREDAKNILGVGMVTISKQAATNVRAKVTTAEGSTSTVTIHLVSG